MDNLVEWVIISFLAGWVCSYIRVIMGIKWKNYKDNMERLKEYDKRANACPHGYTDWDNCPDCRH